MALCIKKLLKSLRVPIPTSSKAKDVIASVQALTIRSAVQSAGTAVRLDSVSGQANQVSASLDEMLRTAEQLHTQSQHVSSASAQTLEAAGEMQRLSNDGRNLSKETIRCSVELQDQMQATVRNIEKLVQGVTDIIRVSETIEDIARTTTLLSFNATIEAAKAGALGRGFSVVAGEVRSLARHAEGRTKEIKTILDELKAELTPAREAVSACRNLVESTASSARTVGDSLERIAELAIDTDHNMRGVATIVVELSENIARVFGSLKSATASSELITEEAKALVIANYAVSQMVQECFTQYAKIDVDSQFHRGLRKARELSQLAREVFEDAIDHGRCSLDDVLAYEYREIKGSDIQSLARLFDVSRVPSKGFDPPKFSTRYDAAVDLELQRVMDRVNASEPSLLLVTVSDLNLYMPAHHIECTQDWTGDHQKDLAGNRVKRFFYDKWTNTEGVRVGLGPNSDSVPNRASREQFIEAGCVMEEQPETTDCFSVRLAVRDTSAVMEVLHVPIFVKGHRYGAVVCAWAVTDDIIGVSQ